LLIEGVAWLAQRIPAAINLTFLDESRYFSFMWLLNYPHEAEWTQLQAQYFSEKSGISESNPKPLDL
jgi:hypothetical protein